MSRPRSRQYREGKRMEAEARQSVYARLTIDQKLAKLNAGGYKATKQRSRLAGLK